MTRDECEKQIEKKLRDIDKIVQRYNPGNQYMELVIIDGKGQFFNAYWETNKQIHVDGIMIGKGTESESLL